MIEIIGVFLGVGAVPCLLLGVIMLISFLTCDYIEKFVVKAFCSFKNRRRQRYRGKNNGEKLQPNSEPCSKQQTFTPSAPQYQQQQEYPSPNPQNQRTDLNFDSIEEIDRHFHEEKFRLAASSGTSTRKKSRKLNVNLTNSTIPPPTTTSDNAQSNLSSHNISSPSSSSRQQEQGRNKNLQEPISTRVTSQSRFEDLPPPYSECFKQATQEPTTTTITTSIKKIPTSKEKSD